MLGQLLRDTVDPRLVGIPGERLTDALRDAVPDNHETPPRMPCQQMLRLTATKAVWVIRLACRQLAHVGHSFLLCAPTSRYSHLRR